ncbi:MAG: hypothetical protein ACK56I_04085, partial [bacterium]
RNSASSQRDHRSIQYNRREAGGAWPIYRMMTSGGEEELAKGSANTGPAIEPSERKIDGSER